MAGTGRPPKDPDKRAGHRKNQEPGRGEWKPAVGIGWQHGTKTKKIPDVPDGLMPASVVAWKAWMGAWFAAHWTPEDLPGLRQVIRIYDEVERGEFQRASELRLQMDTYGITPKGQQDRRWKAPVEDKPVKPKTETKQSERYGHLRVAGE